MFFTHEHNRNTEVINKQKTLEDHTAKPDGQKPFASILQEKERKEEDPRQDSTKVSRIRCMMQGILTFFAARTELPRREI